jgi:FtsP/CotA-like multicopper oxidase with cupredoxin domain
MKDMGGMMDHSKMDHSNMSTMEDMKSGWAKTGAPDGAKTLTYSDLRYLGTQKDRRSAMREVVIRLGGNMERYIWTMNGKKYKDAKPIELVYGERVRIKFINETMMAHPMHLHGMFFQLENGQPISKLPNKNMVIVPPGDSYSVLLTADEAGEWAFHCHLLYHMMAGMMNKVVVAKLDPNEIPKHIKKTQAKKEMKETKVGHNHAH